MNRPEPNEYLPYYEKYITRVDDDVLAELENQIHIHRELASNIPVSRRDFAYANGKWTVKEVLGHIIDTERIMTGRLLRFSRNDQTPLPGFDENEYVEHSNYARRDYDGLVEEFVLLRKSGLYLFRSLTEEQLSRSGLANDKSITVRALLFILAGHVKHHHEVLKDRYL